jgi:hypothetical protein
MTRHLLVLFLALLSLALTACGGGGEKAAEPTTARQPTAAVQATPMITPIITGNLFESPDKGYSVRFPEGWKPLSDFLPGPDFWVDAFFEPEEIEGVQPNMAVTCEHPSEGMTLKEYFEQKVEVVRQVAGVEPEVSSREIAGQEALVSRFVREKNVQSPIEKTEVYFFTEACAWGLSLTAPYSQRDSYQDLFEEFLGSFHLLD